MRHLLVAKDVGLELVISCMENDLLPIGIDKEVAIASANRAVTVHDFMMRKGRDKESARYSPAMAIGEVASEL
jgi:hypothetical protein